MNETQRIHAIRCILFALTARTGKSNELMKFSARIKKRSFSEVTNTTDSNDVEDDATQPVAITKYAIKGYDLCRAGFLAIVHISSATLQRHAAEVASLMRINQYETDRAKGRTGKLSVQTNIVVAFLKRYGMLHGLPCPIGRGKAEGNAVRLLCNGTKKNEVYEQYLFLWDELLPNAMEGTTSAIPPSAPQFLKVWSSHMPMIRISTGGTDYCDTCVSFQNNIKVADDSANYLFKMPYTVTEKTQIPSLLYIEHYKRSPNAV